MIEYAVIAKKKFWDGLPADIRTTLEGAMRREQIRQRHRQGGKHKALTMIKATGKIKIITLTPDARRRDVLVVRLEQESRIGRTSFKASTRTPASNLRTSDRVKLDARVRFDTTDAAAGRCGVFMGNAVAGKSGRSGMLKVLDHLKMAHRLPHGLCDADHLRGRLHR